MLADLFVSASQTQHKAKVGGVHAQLQSHGITAYALMWHLINRESWIILHFVTHGNIHTVRVLCCSQCKEFVLEFMLGLILIAKVVVS